MNIFITGATDGAGLSMLESLSKDHNVFFLGRNEGKVIELEERYGVIGFVCDIGKAEEVKQCFNEFFEKYENLDCLINNAGIFLQGEIETNSTDDFDEMVNTNLKGPIYSTRQVVPRMKEEKKGLIININSQSGITHKAERALYNSTKWGFLGFSKSLRDELMPFGIRVTDVCPGKMKTKIFEKQGIEKNMKDALDLSHFVKLIRFIVEQPDDVSIPEIEIVHFSKK